MTIVQMLSKERERYVSLFIEERDRIARENPQTVGELLISVNSPEIPYPFRYLRVDALSSMADGTPWPRQIEISPDPSFEAREFDLGTFVVQIYPFSWNSIQIAFDKPIANTGWLSNWVTSQLDTSDSNERGKSDLSLAIHSFSQVERLGDWWHMTGDFGTAPVDSLIDLIELLADHGMTRIVIQSGQTLA